MVSNTTAKAPSTDQKPTLTVGCHHEKVNPRGPRTNVKRLSSYDADTPLQPPKFGFKSKLPSLHYGGLQLPTLHCVATSLYEGLRHQTLRSTSLILQSHSLAHPLFEKEQQNSNPLLNVTIQKQKEADHSFDIFEQVQFSSKLYCEIHDSEFVAQHIDRIADSLGTGGLLAYIQIWNHLACWCHCHSQIPAAAPPLLLDYLHASDHLKRKRNTQPSRTWMMTHTLDRIEIGSSSTYSCPKPDSFRLLKNPNSNPI